METALGIGWRRAELLSVLIVIFGCLTPALAAPTIAVTGNRTMDADTIRSFLHAGPGGFTPEAIDAGVKSLYATQWFRDVRVTPGDGGIEVKVVENPPIARIAFEGNKTIKDKQLQAIVQSKERGPLSLALVHDDVQRILELYRRNGRFNARVEPKTIDTRGPAKESIKDRTKERGVALVFEIDEGPRTGISRIEFSGNRAFEANKLRGAIKSGQTNLLSPLLNNDFYDPDKVEADRDLLQRYYRDRGYPDMRVTAAGPRLAADGKSLILGFDIQEGSRTRLASVEVASEVNGIDAAAVQSLPKTRAGDLYSAAAIDTSVETMLTHLARHGQPFTQVRARTEPVPGTDTVKLIYAVTPGPRLYVQRIEIHGNSKTRDAVIRRELTFGEGDALNRALVQQSVKRLETLGYFKSVKFREERGSAPDRVVLALDVAEQDTGEFGISGGYSTADGWVTNVTVGDRNVLGTGNSVRLSVDYGQYTKGFDLSLTRPDAIADRISLAFDVFAKQTDASSYQSYSSLFYGLRLGVTTPLNDQIAVQWRYALTNQSLAVDPSLGTASIPVQQAAAAGPLWVSAFGTTLSYSTLDNERRPTSGFRSDISNDVAGFGGNVKFLRNTDDVRYYQPVAGDVVAMTRAQTGMITPWGGQSLPLLNGFFGGPQYVRGFAPNGFGPRDVTPGTTNDNLGGNAYWATSAELQSPIPMLPPEFALKASVFADAGSLWRTSTSSFSPALSNSMQVDNSRAVRSSIGAGLTWDSVLGPIRVDYAYALTKGPADVTQRLHFGYGAF